MEALYYDLEMPLVPIIAEMELHGVMLDLPMLRELSGFSAANCPTWRRKSSVVPDANSILIRRNSWERSCLID
jgi:DNA polymerase-1